MKTIEEILDENMELVNELVNAGFRQGCSVAEVGPTIGLAISTFANRAIFARTYANARIAGFQKRQRPKRDDQS